MRKNEYDMIDNNTTTLKDYALGLVVLIIFFTLYGIAGYNDTHYTMGGTVIEVGENNEVTVEDTAGYVWDIYADNVIVGDNIKMTYDNKGTINVREDDVVIDIKVLD